MVSLVFIKHILQLCQKIITYRLITAGLDYISYELQLQDQ